MAMQAKHHTDLPVDEGLENGHKKENAWNANNQNKKIAPKKESEGPEFCPLSAVILLKIYRVLFGFNFLSDNSSPACKLRVIPRLLLLIFLSLAAYQSYKCTFEKKSFIKPFMCEQIDYSLLALTVAFGYMAFYFLSLNEISLGRYFLGKSISEIPGIHERASNAKWSRQVTHALASLILVFAFLVSLGSSLVFIAPQGLKTIQGVFNVAVALAIVYMSFFSGLTVAVIATSYILLMYRLHLVNLTGSANSKIAIHMHSLVAAIEQTISSVQPWLITVEITFIILLYQYCTELEELMEKIVYPSLMKIHIFYFACLLIPPLLSNWFLMKCLENTDVEFSSEKSYVRPETNAFVYTPNLRRPRFGDASGTGTGTTTQWFALQLSKCRFQITAGGIPMNCTFVFVLSGFFWYGLFCYEIEFD